MQGDCSMRVGGELFSAEEIAACAARQGVLSVELEWPAGSCTCPQCAKAEGAVMLSPEEVMGLVEQAEALGCRRWILVADHDGDAEGDALRRLIEETRRRGMQVELWSDGKGMTGEWARFLYEQRAAVSLPREALGGEAVTRLKEAGYGRAEGPGIAVRLMMGPENIDELPEQWRQVRADGMEPRLQILGAGERKGQAVGGVTAERIEKVLEELARRGAEEFGQLWSVPASAARACKRHLYACHVAACGTVYACAGVGIPLGNVRATTFKEILELSEVLENLRDFRHRVKEPCRSCCQTTDCYGCRGAAYEATGDYLAGDGLCGRARAVEIPALPVEAGGMIPHGPTMRVVGRLIEVGERRGVMEYVVAADSPMVDGAGRLDECACIEMIAQTFAAAHGFHLAAGAAPQGLLLGVRNLAIEGTARVGDRLLVEVRKQMRFGDFSIVEGAVRHADGRQMASGEIKLWGPAEDESAAKG